MIDTQIIKDRGNGLIAKKKLHQADEKIFIKAQGIEETIIQSQNSVIQEKKDLETEKQTLKDLKAKKTKAVSGSAAKIISKMNEVLPQKNAVFDCVDGLVMGMLDGDTVLRFNSLSGGQKHEMKAALNNVLGANIIVIEGAELDSERMTAVLEDLVNVDKQIIINTCHGVGNVPEGFDVVELSS